jgi:hypothetical protein
LFVVVGDIHTHLGEHLCILFKLVQKVGCLATW